MNALAVINDAASRLGTTSYPVRIAALLNTDDDGKLQLPSDSAAFVIHLITGEPYHEWGSTPLSTVRLQVDAWSSTPGEALSMLADAQPLLAANKWIPGVLRNLGRDGTYQGAAQDFERGTT